MTTFVINRLFYFVGRVGNVRIGVLRMRTCPTYCSAMILCIMVDHELLNVDNHYDSLIKYAIYLSILAILA